MNNPLFWHIKVYDAESGTTTQLERYGNLPDIIEELKEDGLWEYVSARPDANQCIEVDE